MIAADRVDLSVLLDRHLEVGGDGRHYPGPKRSKTFAKRFFALTARRQEVAMLAARGLSNRAIAEKLDLTEGTVKIHLHKIYWMLDLHSKIDLAIAVARLPRAKTGFTEDRGLSLGGAA